MKRIAHTNIIAGQSFYVIPFELWPKIEVEVYNQKTKTYKKIPYLVGISVYLSKRRKTDKELKLTF